MRTPLLQLIGGIILIAVSQLALAQGSKQLRETLFSEIDAIYELTKKERAKVLSPDTFAEGYKSYVAAQNDFKKGKKLTSIKKSITKARTKFEKALEQSTYAKLTFADTLQARVDAIKAKSHKFAAKQWKDAEVKFATATYSLEKGSLKNANRYGAEAEKIYRTAELTAIKGNSLNATRALLKQAKDLKVKKYAPVTLQKAKDLLAKAEQALNENRYDIDEPRSLVREAQYEANHGIYLADMIKKVRAGKLSVEQVILDYEKPLIKIAGSANIVANLDKGHQKPTAEIIEYIEKLEAKSSQLTQDVADMETTMASMQKELGSLSSERIGLKRIEQQRKQAERIERMFTRDEAQVLRKGNSIILRLIGLNFAVNKSNLTARNLPLLRKVEKAVNLFSSASLNVEGHTDSFGSDKSNLELSQDRASSVQDFMLTRMDLKNAQIKAVGFGETRPVANNETVEGRQKNRRIDIVITPK